MDTSACRNSLMSLCMAVILQLMVNFKHAQKQRQNNEQENATPLPFCSIYLVGVSLIFAANTLKAFNNNIPNTLIFAF